MGHARHIGRVGALAVALGIEVAIANSPGIALAEPTSSSSSTDSSTGSASTDPSSSSPSSAPFSPGAASSSTQASTTSSSQLASSTVPVAMAVQASGGANTSVTGPDPVVTKPTTGANVGTPSTVDATPGADPTTTPTPPTQAAAWSSVESTTPTSAVENADPSEALAAPPSGSTSTGGKAYSATTSNVPVRVANIVAPSLISLPQLDASARVATTSASRMMAAATLAIATVSTQASTAAVVAAVAPAAVSVPASAGNILSDIVSSLLSVVGLKPLAASGPAAPTQAPALWTVLAWVRREIEQTLYTLTTPPAAQQVSAPWSRAPICWSTLAPKSATRPCRDTASVTVPGWTVTGTPTVIEYGTLRRLPWPFGSAGPTLPAFLGFPSANRRRPAAASSSSAADTWPRPHSPKPSTSAPRRPTSTPARALHAERTTSAASYWTRPRPRSPSTSWTPTSCTLGTGSVGPVTVLDRGLQTGLLATPNRRDDSGRHPQRAGGRDLHRLQPAPGNYNNAYADNLSFTVGAALPAPAPPAPPVSTVGALDHVFMVYLENKGYADIVGSPNAPYLNSLINAYGYASNYYALTHPSDPNYYPILGGSDFGTNYNCAAELLRRAQPGRQHRGGGKTWAGYADGGGGYTTPTDRLPFLAFGDIYNDPARVATHLFDSDTAGHRSRRARPTLRTSRGSPRTTPPTWKAPPIPSTASSGGP